MVEFFAVHFCEAYKSLASHIDALHEREKEDRSKPAGQQFLSTGRARFVAQGAILPMIGQLESLGIKDLSLRAKMLYTRAMSADRKWTAQLLTDQLIELRREIGL